MAEKIKQSIVYQPKIVANDERGIIEQLIDSSFLPYQILQMFPYIATILVMIFTFKRSRVPGFLGNNYDREKRSL